jgi:hypothetical protein
MVARDAAIAAKEAVAQARKLYPSRMPENRPPAGWAEPGRRPEIGRALAPIVRDGAGEAARNLPAVSSTRQELSMSEGEYQRRRNECGPDGLLTDEAMALRDRETTMGVRRPDRFHGRRYKDEEGQ